MRQQEGVASTYMVGRALLTVCDALAAAERVVPDYDLSRDSVTCLPAILTWWGPTYVEFVETTTMSRTTVTRWVAIDLDSICWRRTAYR